MSGGHNVWIRTFVYDTGTSLPDSQLLPIELVDKLPHKGYLFEGSLEFRVGSVAVLSNSLLPCGYIDDWWVSALSAIPPLLGLHSACWALPGKQCHVSIDVIPGTRKATVQTVWPEHPPLSPAVEAHVPSLVDAMLEEAQRFFRWVTYRDTSEEQARVAALRVARAPWRHG